MSFVQTPAFERKAFAFSKSKIQNALLWLLVFSSFFVFFEPSPYEILFLITASAFLMTDFKLSKTFSILIFSLILFNLGGFFAVLPFITESEPVTYIAITFYMCTSAVFFAGLFLNNTYTRIETVSHAWICAAVIASVCGMMGYFDILGTAEIFTRYGRATGTFKDPNVFGPFLCGPALLLIEGFFSGRFKKPFLPLVFLLIILGGIFFSFSRGAWAVTLLSVSLCGFLIFITSSSGATRTRVILVAFAGLVLLMLILTAILSIESIRDFFLQRFVLFQDYDDGPKGRFGKISSAVVLLLDRPNGLGPLHFTDYFTEAPHNAYVNAFSSYGWLGGFSYFGFVISTFYMGWTTLWKRTPWQNYFIALWSFTFIQYLQGLQIDTDHWRHLWMVVGATWGIGTASLNYTNKRSDCKN